MMTTRFLSSLLLYTSILLSLVFCHRISAFVPSLPFIHRSLTPTHLEAKRKPNTNVNVNVNPNKKDDTDNDNNTEEDGEVGSGPNWIERSFPVDVGVDDGEKVQDYDLGISGVSFQTGGLSKRMFHVIMTKSQFAANPIDEIKQAFTLYSMDFTAKEACKAALKQNGLEIALAEDQEDEGMWGDVDSIRLLDDNDQPLTGVFDSAEEAIEQGGWTPGQGFDFVVRQVPAKMKELGVEELLQALDPDGTMSQEARDANMTLPGDKDDDGVYSLEDLANDGVQRTENSPRGATTEEEAFSGIAGKRGYRPINLSDLLTREQDGTENQDTLMHVMNAMVAHGALIVDMTDGGKNMEKAQQIAKMWQGLEEFYNKLDSSDAADSLSPMDTVMDAGSQSAKAGYASVDNDSLQFLETRRNRFTGDFLPADAKELLGDEVVEALGDVFEAVTSAGKAAVRIAVAAGTMEWEALGDAEASKAAALMAAEVLDDGTSFDKSSEYPICMSPHRLCRYSNNKAAGEDANNSREIFGAHVDSSWVTIVPCAAVSGLEVLDETEEEWYRPELAARRHFEELGEAEDKNLPWYSRYVVLMPGELLQMASRNEIPAAVHRVVATQNCPSRMSAPILLRCRPGVKMDVSRYLGGTGGYPLLEECDGKTIEEIHDALQPTSFQ